jgi:hypothetical protein
LKLSREQKKETRFLRENGFLKSRAAMHTTLTLDAVLHQFTFHPGEDGGTHFSLQLFALSAFIAVQG